MREIGLQAFASLYEGFPGFGIKIILHSFHLVGVNSSNTRALYSKVMNWIMSSGKCLKIIGFRPSVPGDFLLLKPRRAVLTLSGFIQSGLKLITSFLEIFLSVYVVVLIGVAEGKCCVSRYSSVSGPA